MAHSGVDIGNRRNFLSFNRHRSSDPTSYRRAVVRIDIHGYRLCYITDVSQRNDYLWRCHRSIDNHYPQWAAYPEGMSFAILIMNAFTPLINMYVKPKRFGEVVKHG